MQMEISDPVPGRFVKQKARTAALRAMVATSGAGASMGTKRLQVFLQRTAREAAEVAAA